VNKQQVKDAEECVRMEENGETKDCIGCSCNVCLAQVAQKSTKITEGLENDLQVMRAALKIAVDEVMRREDGSSCPALKWRRKHLEEICSDNCIECWCTYFIHRAKTNLERSI
jgi:hypothetical protein